MTKDWYFGRGRVHELVADIVDQTVGASALPAGVFTETGARDQDQSPMESGLQPIYQVFLVLLREAISNQRSSFRRLVDEVGVVPTAPGGIRMTATRHSPAALRPNHKLMPAEISKLVDTYRRGATVFELAEQFGIHRQTVSAHLHREGVAMRSRTRMTPRLVTHATELYEAGWSTIQIGKELGLGPSTVGRYLTRLRSLPIMRSHSRTGLSSVQARTAASSRCQPLSRASSR